MHVDSLFFDMQTVTIEVNVICDIQALFTIRIGGFTVLNYRLSEKTVKAIQEDTQLSMEQLQNLTVSGEIDMVKAATGKNLDYSKERSSNVAGRGNVYINEGYYMTSQELDCELDILTKEIMGNLNVSHA
jgi:hypothetical protein